MNYGFTSNKQDAVVQQETEEKFQNNEESIVKTAIKQKAKMERCIY